MVLPSHSEHTGGKSSYVDNVYLSDLEPAAQFDSELHLQSVSANIAGMTQCWSGAHGWVR
jgi:hypothetical protein